MFCIQSWLEMKKEVTKVETADESSTTPFSVTYEVKKIIIHTPEASLLPLWRSSLIGIKSLLK